MKFVEKLRQMTEGKNKSDLSRQAGLQPTAISNYLSRGYEPSASIALHLARTLDVDLAWLVDDAADWPPPAKAQEGLALVDNETLMMEVARRYRREVIDFINRAEMVKKLDRAKLRRDLTAWKGNEPLPPAAVEQLILYFQYGQILQRWWVEGFANEHHAQMPGNDRDPDELSIETMRKYFVDILSDGDLINRLLGSFARADLVELMTPKHRTLALR